MESFIAEPVLFLFALLVSAASGRLWTMARDKFQRTALNKFILARSMAIIRCIRPALRNVAELECSGGGEFRVLRFWAEFDWWQHS